MCRGQSARHLRACHAHQGDDEPGVVTSSGNLPLHEDGTSESIVLCDGTDVMMEVGLIKIPPSGISDNAVGDGHGARSVQVTRSSRPANIPHSLEKGKVSIAELKQKQKHKQ